MDLGARYRSGRLRIGPIVDGRVAAQPLSATEHRDVHDLVAHVVEIAERCR